MTNNQKIEFIKACKSSDKNDLVQFLSNYTQSIVNSSQDKFLKKLMCNAAITICNECLPNYTFVQYVMDSYNFNVSGISLSETEYWLSKIVLLDVDQYKHYSINTNENQS